MKSSFRLYKPALTLSTAGGIITVLYIFFTFYLGGEPISLVQIILGGVIVLLYWALGYGLAIMTGTNFHRKVVHPVNPDNLVPGTQYWLNGETSAVFLEKDPDMGTYRFSIWGVNDIKDPDDYELILPWKVRTYFSTQQEIFD